MSRKLPERRFDRRTLTLQERDVHNGQLSLGLTQPFNPHREPPTKAHKFVEFAILHDGNFDFMTTSVKSVNQLSKSRS